MKLENRVVFVTGGSDGMGKATVLEAAREGAKVCFIGRNPAKCEQVLELLKAEGLTAIYFKADVEKEDELKCAIQNAVEALGPIDVLVNNVGYDLQALVHAVPSDKWDKDAAYTSQRFLEGQRHRILVPGSFEKATQQVT